MDYALRSIIGKRENQEDYGIIRNSEFSGGLLAVISDGMGGQVAGEVASLNAVNGFIDSFNSNASKNLALKLNVALDKSNRGLAKSIAANPKLRGMGATLIAAHIVSNRLNWISVGDSILYLYRTKKLHRLNEDHSMMPVLQESIKNGKISHEEARVHPHRNALRSALTGEEMVLIDLHEEPFILERGDLLLLSTDGILTLNEIEISSVLNASINYPAEVIADQLLSAVTQKNKSKQDNTLVEVIKVQTGSRLSRGWLAFTALVLIILVALFLALWGQREYFYNLLSFNDKRNNELVTSNAATTVTPIVIPEPVVKYVTNVMTIENKSSTEEPYISKTVKPLEQSKSEKKPKAESAPKNNKELKDEARTNSENKKSAPSGSIASESVDLGASAPVPASSMPIYAAPKEDGEKDSQLPNGNHPKLNKLTPE